MVYPPIPLSLPQLRGPPLKSTNHHIRNPLAALPYSKLMHGIMKQEPNPQLHRRLSRLLSYRANRPSRHKTLEQTLISSPIRIPVSSRSRIAQLGEKSRIEFRVGVAADGFDGAAGQAVDPAGVGFREGAPARDVQRCAGGEFEVWGRWGGDEGVDG